MGGKTVATVPRILCIVGVQRTGSSRVRGILKGFARLVVMGEIFNPTVADNVARANEPMVRGLLPPATADTTTDHLVRWARENPCRVLDALLEEVGERALGFKLFPGHLAARAAAEATLSRPDLRGLVLWRRPIDVYISLLKAQQSGAWKYADTSGLRVKADVDDFIRRCRHWHRWYLFARYALTTGNVRFRELDFAGDFSDRELADDLAAALQDLQIDPGTWQDGTARLVKQDRETDYARKVVNWDSFIAEIRRRDLERIAFSERGLA